MVADARGVLDAVGSESVWVAGYGVGAVVALHVAALDVRVRGGAFVAPAAAGIPLLANEPAYGLSDLLCAMRAAPALVVSPRLDAEADADEVRDCVRTAQDAGAELDHRVLADYHRLSVQTRQLMRTWLHDAAARTTPAAA